MDKNYSLAEMQSKYKDCNLLLPVSTEAQINPFYALTVMEVKADLSENSGDIFKVGSINTGMKGPDDKDIWAETFSPAKPLLMKLATAAGIHFDPNNTYGTRPSKNTYKAKAFGAMRLPDGTAKTHCDEKLIDLDDEEDRFRLEFMDKSIQGITDNKAAQEAAKLFKGEWFETKNKWNKKVQAYKIADEDRQTYIDRSVMVNMSLLRKSAAEKAMSGAILRVIRALIGMKGQYTKEELKKPFAVPRVTFSPDYNDPKVRWAMLEQGLNSVSNMFGAMPAPMIGAAQDADYTIVSDMFNPDDHADNAAFASDGDAMTPPEDYNFAEPSGQAASASAVPPPAQQPNGEASYVCADCGVSINDTVYSFSLKKYEIPLCMKCQRGAGSA